MTSVRQRDVVRFRIRPQDTVLHPGVILSGVEWCASDYVTILNVPACSNRPPAASVKPHQVVLNRADGLDHQSTVDCRFFHVIPKSGVSEIIGRISIERQRAIGRKINEVLRLSL